MKMRNRILWSLPSGRSSDRNRHAAVVAMAVLAAGWTAGAQPAPPPPPPHVSTVTIAGAGGATASAEAGPGQKERRIVVRAIEPSSIEARPGSEVTWLGVGAEEVSPALAAQLNLKSGEGLLVTYVSSNSPAGPVIQKNDVLVKMDDQLLVHPSQLRKLVQAHKEGDTVELVFFRGGKQESATVKLAKTRTGFTFFGDERSWRGDLGDLKVFNAGEIGENVRREMEVLRKSLAESGVNSENFRTEIKRGVEEARKALEEAVRHSSNAAESLGPSTRILKEFSQRGPVVDNDTKVTLRKETREVKTMVKTDDTGTYVLVATPQKHLTVTDPQGKVLFEGPVDTSEQQEKVPREAWKKVEQMLEEMAQDKVSVHEHGTHAEETPEEPEIDF